MKVLDIAIAGAGIGGLAAAALLGQRGHRVTVFDRFAAPAPVGSGLVIQPVGQAVLAETGCLDAALAYGNPIRRMIGHEARSGARVLDVLYDQGDGRFGLAIHRAALFESLLGAARAAGATLESNAEVTAAHHGTLHLGARRRGPFDLVVDAAGAGSPLSPLKARALSYGAIWGTVTLPAKALPADQLRQVYDRADKMIGVLPIGTLPGDPVPKSAIFWSLPRDAHAEWRATGLAPWQDDIARLFPEAAPYFAQVRQCDAMTMARYAHGTLRRPYAQRLAIIGDAAHRASPQLGQGANMALLDAAALARALDQHPVDDALPAYAAARRWHVRIYQLMSAVFTPQYQSGSRLQPWLRDRIFFPLGQFGPMPRLLTAIVCGTMIPPLGSLSDPRRTAPSGCVSRAR